MSMEQGQLSALHDGPLVPAAQPAASSASRVSASDGRSNRCSLRARRWITGAAERPLTAATYCSLPPIIRCCNAAGPVRRPLHALEKVAVRGWCKTCICGCTNVGHLLAASSPPEQGHGSPLSSYLQSGVVPSRRMQGFVGTCIA